MNLTPSKTEALSEDSRTPRRTPRFLALADLLQRAWTTLRRFPFVLASALAAAAITHRWIDLEMNGADVGEHFIPLLLTCMLGIPLFFAIRMMGEARGWSTARRNYAALAGLVALTIYYTVLPFPLHNADGYRFVLLLAALHLWIAFAPFVGRRASENGFWQYNRLLFQRFVVAALYSGVLFTGLSLALAACDALLGLDVDEETYFQLFVWIGFLYNTWFFLAGVPQDVRGLDEMREYPSGLRIFTQYVLIPLVAVYLAILYAYLGKIIWQWELPEGWVGYPIIGVSIAGMLALLLVHPLRESEEHTWIARYSRLFYWALFPLMGLVAVAIWTRIGEYGITEKRYLLVVAAAWLFAIAAFFTLSKAGSIRTIPISLCAVTLLAAVGPLSATAVSRRSQVGRLREILIVSEVMEDGRIRETHPDVSFEQEREISAIVQYLYDLHGLDVIRDWYPEPSKLFEQPTANAAVEAMGLEYRTRWETGKTLSVSFAAPDPIPVEGFDYMYEVQTNRSGSVRLGEAAVGTLTLRLTGTRLELVDSTDPEARLTIDLAPTLEGLWEEGARGWRETPLQVRNENARYRVTVYITGVNAEVGDSLSLQHLTAKVLVGTR